MNVSADLTTTHREADRPKVDLWRPRSKLKAMVCAYAEDKAAVGAALILCLLALSALFAPVISPHDPLAGDSGKRFLPAGTPGHVLGLDYNGRDVLSRLIWGGRVSLPLAVTPVVIASVIGLFLGLTAGYRGGVLDSCIMRATDVLFALPDVLLAILIAVTLGPGISSIVLATTLVIIAPLTRVTYVAAREQRRSEYVIAAHASGASFMRIIWRHLLPNVFPPVLVYATSIVGLIIVFTAGLSFLGLGVSPPTADWGLMVSEGRTVLSVAPHVSTFPGAVIAVAAICFSLVGDGLRHALDPQQR